MYQRSFLLVAITLLLTPLSLAAYEPREGDIVFQSLPHNPLVDAIESVSGSSLSHCGIVVKEREAWGVLEALGEVKVTPLGEWVARSRDRRLFAYRFRVDAGVDIAAFIAAARSYLGRNYDFHYAFGNDEIYCSELVYLAFERVKARPLGEVKKLGELNWAPNETFIRSLENGESPLDRVMITPVALTQAVEVEPVGR